MNKSIYFLKNIYFIFLTYYNDIAFWTWLHCLNTFQACISLDTVWHTYFSHEQLVPQKHLPDMILQSRWYKRRNGGKSDGGLPAGPHKALMQAFPKISSESWVSLTIAGSALSLLDWSCTLLGYSPLCIHAGRLIYSNCSSEFRFQGKSSSPW